MSPARPPALPPGLAASLAAASLALGALVAVTLTPERPVAVGLLWLGAVTTGVAPLLPRLRPRWLRLGVVALTAGALPLLALDLLAWHTARQGLASLADIGLAEGWAGLHDVIEASGVGVPTLLAVLAVPPALGALVARLWARHERAGRLVPWAAAALVAVTFAAAACWVDGGPRWPYDALRALVGDRHVLTRQAVAPPFVDLRHRPPGPALPRSTTNDPVSPTEAPRTLLVVVVESLRHDAIDAQTTPTLARFARRAARFPQARAAANATHPSWYALLFSRHGLWWHALRSQSQRAGAPPLVALRRAGFRVAFYAGAGLNYYGVSAQAVDPVAHVRVDARDCFARGHTSRPALDRCALTEAVAELRRAAHDDLRRAVFVFVDGTHFPYAWADGTQPRFAPVTRADALRLGQVDDRRALRNRYRSALWSVDAALAPLFAALAPLREKGGVGVVVTGDHGEELLEHGRLSHDSELCDLQTRVPLLVELPGLAAGDHPGLASHVDVLPTLLQAVGVPSPPVDGVALQRGARPWALVVHTAAHSPSLVAVQTRTHTLEIAVDRRDDPAAIRRLYLLRETAPDGSAVRADLRPRHVRAALWRRHGAALRGVFGATEGAVVGDEARSRPPDRGHAGGDARVHGPRPGAAPAASPEPASPRPAPLYQATWTLLRPATKRAGPRVRVHNGGRLPWLNDVALSFHWRRAPAGGGATGGATGDAGGASASDDPEGPRVVLPRALAPSAACEVTLPPLQPPTASGPWAGVEVDMVREGVTWFAARGSPTLWIPVPRLGARPARGAPPRDP